MMPDSQATELWRQEREAIEREMDVVLRSHSPASEMDRRVRQMQFAALIERRNAAAQGFLKAARPAASLVPADQSPVGSTLPQEDESATLVPGAPEGEGGVVGDRPDNADS